MRYSPILAVAAAVIAAFVALFVWGGSRQPLRDRVIPTRDIVVVRGEVPSAFTAVTIPGCWECNDFAKPVMEMERAKKSGTPYVLVICGAKARTDVSSFGPSWPNIAIITNEASGSTLPPLASAAITVGVDGGWVIGQVRRAGLGS